MDDLANFTPIQVAESKTGSQSCDENKKLSSVVDLESRSSSDGRKTPPAQINKSRPNSSGKKLKRTSAQFLEKTPTKEVESNREWDSSVVSRKKRKTPSKSPRGLSKKSLTTPKCSTPQKREKSSTELEDTNKIPQDDADSFNQAIEAKAQKLNMNATNVKSCIRMVLTDDKVLKMFNDVLLGSDKEAPTNHDPNPTGFSPKLTRAKVKNFLERLSIESPSKHKAGPSILDLELSEEEDDEEYNPEKDAEAHDSDDDESVTSSRLSDFGGSPYPATPTTPRPQQPFDNKFKTPKTSPLPSAARASTSSSSMRNLGNAFDSCLDKEGSENRGDDTIALRTRSKLPLTSTSITDIESAFIAPDITEDLYFKTGDDDWVQFLSSLYKTQDDSVTEDDANDPEFNYIAEAEKELPDEEDFRFDRPTRISKKELTSLISELEDLFDDDEVLPHEVMANVPSLISQPQMAPSSNAHPSHSKASNETVDENIRHTSPSRAGDEVLDQMQKQQADDEPSNVQETRVRESKSIEQHTEPEIDVDASVPENNLESENDAASTEINNAESQIVNCVTEEQRALIEDNMRKHIQLLAQSYLLIQDKPFVIPSDSNPERLLLELDHFRKTSAAGEKSLFNSWNLDPALKVIEDVKESKKEDQSVPPSDYTSSLPASFTFLSPKYRKLMVHSPAFIYPHLLPTLRAVKVNKRRFHRFLPSEDNLIALGLEQASSCQGVSAAELIAKLFVRCKSVIHVTSRICYMSRLKDDNAIKHVKEKGRLPPDFPKPKLDPFQLKAPKFQDSALLPNWCVRIKELSCHDIRRVTANKSMQDRSGTTPVLQQRPPATTALPQFCGTPFVISAPSMPLQPIILQLVTAPTSNYRAITPRLPTSANIILRPANTIISNAHVNSVLSGNSIIGTPQVNSVLSGNTIFGTPQVNSVLSGNTIFGTPQVNSVLSGNTSFGITPQVNSVTSPLIIPSLESSVTKAEVAVQTFESSTITILDSPIRSVNDMVLSSSGTKLCTSGTQTFSSDSPDILARSLKECGIEQSPISRQQGDDDGTEPHHQSESFSSSTPINVNKPERKKRPFVRNLCSSFHKVTQPSNIVSDSGEDPISKDLDSSSYSLLIDEEANKSGDMTSENDSTLKAQNQQVPEPNRQIHCGGDASSSNGTNDKSLTPVVAEEGGAEVNDFDHTEKVQVVQDECSSLHGDAGSDLVGSGARPTSEPETVLCDESIESSESAKIDSREGKNAQTVKNIESIASDKAVQNSVKYVSSKDEDGAQNNEDSEVVDKILKSSQREEFTGPKSEGRAQSRKEGVTSEKIGNTSDTKLITESGKKKGAGDKSQTKTVQEAPDSDKISDSKRQREEHLHSSLLGICSDDSLSSLSSPLKKVTVPVSNKQDDITDGKQAQQTALCTTFSEEKNKQTYVPTQELSDVDKCEGTPTEVNSASDSRDKPQLIHINTRGAVLTPKENVDETDICPKTPPRHRPIAPLIKPSSEVTQSVYIPLPKISPRRRKALKVKARIRAILPKGFMYGSKLKSPSKNAAHVLTKKAKFHQRQRSPVKILPKATSSDSESSTSDLLKENFLPSKKFTRSQDIKSGSESASEPKNTEMSCTDGERVTEQPKAPLVTTQDLANGDGGAKDADGGTLSEQQQAENNELHLDDLMAACTTINYDPKKSGVQDSDTKSKAQKKKESCMAMLEPDVVEADPKKDDRDTAYAQHYFNRVKEALQDDKERFVRFLTLLRDMNKDRSSPIELYADMVTLLAGHQDLVDDFAGFLLSFQAVVCGCLVQNTEFSQIREILRKLEIYCETTSAFSYQRTLRMMSRWLSINKQEPADLSMKDKLLSTLRQVPGLIDNILGYFLEDTISDCQPDEFEEVDMESKLEEGLPIDEFEEIVLPEEREDYNTRQCACYCHTDQNDERLRRRMRHCFSCSLKMYNGNPVLRCGKEFKPLKVVYASEEQEKIAKAKKEAAKIALAKARAQRKVLKGKTKKDLKRLKKRSAKEMKGNLKKSRKQVKANQPLLSVTKSPGSVVADMEVVKEVEDGDGLGVIKDKETRASNGQSDDRSRRLVTAKPGVTEIPIPMDFVPTDGQTVSVRLEKQVADEAVASSSTDEFRKVCFKDISEPGPVLLNMSKSTCSGTKDSNIENNEAVDHAKSSQTSAIIQPTDSTRQVPCSFSNSPIVAPLMSTIPPISMVQNDMNSRVTTPSVQNPALLNILSRTVPSPSPMSLSSVRPPAAPQSLDQSQLLNPISVQSVPLCTASPVVACSRFPVFVSLVPQRRLESTTTTSTIVDKKQPVKDKPKSRKSKPKTPKEFISIDQIVSSGSSNVIVSQSKSVFTSGSEPVASGSGHSAGLPSQIVNTSKSGNLSHIQSHCSESVSNLINETINVSSSDMTPIALSTPVKSHPVLSTPATSNPMLFTPEKSQPALSTPVKSHPAVEANASVVTLSGFDFSSMAAPPPPDMDVSMLNTMDLQQLQYLAQTMSPSKTLSDTMSRFDLMAFIEQSNLTLKDAGQNHSLLPPQTTSTGHGSISLAGALRQHLAEEASKSQDGGTQSESELTTPPLSHTLTLTTESEHLTKSAKPDLTDQTTEWTEDWDRIILNEIAEGDIVSVEKIHGQIPEKTVQEIQSRVNFLIDYIQTTSEVESESDASRLSDMA